MKIRKSLRAPARRAATWGRRRESGVALPIALLLLVLLLGMGVVMVVAVSSDLFINSFYRNNRGAYYGADSGLNIVRKDIENRIVALAPASFAAGTPPIAPGAEASVQSAVISSYGNYQYIQAPSASGPTSHPSQFKLDTLTLNLISMTSSGPAGAPTGYTYTYGYDIDTLGRSQGAEEIRLRESGTLILNAAVTPGGSKTVSFANWGFFVDNQPICSGSYLVPGTVTGPVHTNGGWTFGTTGAYVFTDGVTQVNGNMGFQFSGSCTQSPSAPVSKSGQTISPNFQSGMTVNSPNVNLPQNDFSQKRAVLDSIGYDPANPGVPPPSPTAAEMNAELKRVTGTAYPSAPPAPTTGVYVPYGPNPTTGVMEVTGGGIYVAGNASVVLSTVGVSGQRYTITQSGITTTITTDTTTNTTVITSGATTRTLQGVFMDLASSPSRPGTMLYVDGSITSLKGPAQGQPAIQDGGALTITARQNVAITGDLLYKTPPVTKTANDPCCPGAPAGTLIPGNDKGQVFGIYTATGDIQLNNGQANGMLEIDASLATLSQGGTGGVLNVGAKINTLNIIGGRIQNNIKNINATTRNVLYDRRFATGFAPPWFPSTTINPPASSSATYTSSAQRVRWFNVTQQ